MKEKTITEYLNLEVMNGGRNRVIQKHQVMLNELNQYINENQISNWNAITDIPRILEYIINELKQRPFNY